MFQKTCRGCRFSAPDATIEGTEIGRCRKAPPVFERIEGRQSSSFPLIHFDNFNCGEHRRRPWWWRWFGVYG